MAAEQDIIREFLVSLGFKIDRTGLETFVKTITAASSAVLASVTAIEDNLERLFFASQRTKASAENIRSFGFALGQMGSSAGAALETIENLARFMRNSPGASGLIQSIGVQTQGANGALRDTSDILRDLGKQFASMPYYRANAYAQALGIDEKTLMALRQGLGDFGDDYRNMLAKAGLNLEDATKKSHAFMVETRTLGSAIAILGTKISSSLSEQLTAYIRRFREGLVDNFERISDVVGTVIKAFGVVADVISTMALRAIQATDAVIDWFNGLDEGSKKTIELIGAIGVAWVALNAIFRASPLGRVVLLGTALLTLYDDFKGWKEGAKHLIPWEDWQPEIDKAQRVFGALGAFFRNTASTIKQEFALIGEVIRAVFEGRYADAWKAAKQIAVVETRSNVDSVMSAADSWRSGGGYQDEGTIVEVPDSLLPRGIRNNNPGNLEYRGQTGATLEDNANPRFARFRTPEEGLAALAGQLRRYGQRGVDTVGAVISKYAPSIENDTPGYTGSVARQMGVDANAHLNLNDPAVLQGLMGAIIQVENGRNPYSSEQLAAASGARTGGASGAPVSISQNTTIHVAGGSNPDATGQAIAGQQDGVNQRLVRNVKAVAQ